MMVMGAYTTVDLTTYLACLIMNSLSPLTNPVERVLFIITLVLQTRNVCIKSWKTCPRSHGQQGMEPEFESSKSRSCPRIHVFITIWFPLSLLLIWLDLLLYLPLLPRMNFWDYCVHLVFLESRKWSQTNVGFGQCNTKEGEVRERQVRETRKERKGEKI